MTSRISHTGHTGAGHQVVMRRHVERSSDLTGGSGSRPGGQYHVTTSTELSSNGQLLLLMAKQRPFGSIAQLLRILPKSKSEACHR